MSDDWGDEMASLQASFLQDAWQRVATIEALVEQLTLRPEPALWPQLLRRFHAFAGSGSTYGFPQLTELGRRGEALCRAATTDPQTLLELAAALRRTLEQSVAVHPGGATLAAAAAAQPAPRELRLLLASSASVPPEALRLLAAHDRRLLRADSYTEACTLIQQQLPDALISSGELRGGSGFDLVRLLRDQVGGEVPPALVLGTAAAFLDRVEAIHCGADGVFEDPVEWEAVAQRLSYLLERDTAQPARVLSVEDDPYQAAFVRSVLESAGYQVRTCDHPAGFEAELNAFDPDLVLMDVLLPEASGFDVVRWLRQYERFAALPVLFLTTAGALHERIAGVQAGGDDHLIKPVPPALLLSSVAARLERARLLRTLLERDALTRLLTHTGFMQRARGVWARHAQGGSGEAVFVQLGIDGFRAINDQYGHPVGDRVLVALSSLLRRHLRQSDVIGRHAGDEFAVLIEGLAVDHAVRLVDRLRVEFAELAHPAPGGTVFHACFSAGVALLTPGMRFEDWRKAAQSALDRAKLGGRNRVA